jgi:FtsP/CotA-like multicopper oxidase with cupredoxin domain
MDTEERRSATFVASFLLAGLALLFVPLAIIGIIAVVRESPTAADASATRTTTHVSLKEFAIAGDLTVPAGPVTLHATNAGSAEHNVTLQGGAGTENIASGASGEVDLGSLAAGTYTLICTIPGHAEAGMKAELVVTAGGSASATPSAHEGHTGTDVDWAALDASMVESVQKFPAATAGKGNQLLSPKVLADGTKEFALTTEIVDWEVEPGRIVQAWAYNGQVPGPEIRVAVGDKVRVVLTNKLPMGTDIHHHGLDLPFAMDGVAPITQALVKPGETFVYEFTATKPAVAMYHAHHHGQMQVPNGLFGTFIVGDLQLPRGRTISGTTVPADMKLAQEIPMVLNDAGVIGFSLNGKSFPATAPYQVRNGDWILVHYYNEGLQVHPMHLHQFPQLVVAKDGIPLDQPYFADTVLVAPGERYSVLVHADAAGTWMWHCHILNHVERDTGMFGMVTALVVQ